MRHPYPAPSPLPNLDPLLLTRLREDLIEAKWTVNHLDSLLSFQAREALMREQRVPALRECARVEKTSEEYASATLTRFFMLGCPASVEELETVLPRLSVRGLFALGLVENEESCRESDPRRGKDPLVMSRRVRATFDLRPHAASFPAAPGTSTPREFNWWILSDLAEATTGTLLAPDHVLGIGGATMSLLALTMREPAATALDLGCGCGIQALYLTAHCTHVVATDISARACQITRFNAGLNAVTIDVREGSLFEPVTGESFDLIVSNPPFVITPDSVRQSSGVGMMEYRDGGMSRDHLVEQVIREAPAHMKEGGSLQMLANWEIPAMHDPETQWHERIEEWLSGSAVDAWVVQRDILSPERYVEMWIRDSGGQLAGRRVYEDTYAAWLEDFEAAGVGAIGMGFFALTKLAADVKESEAVHRFELALEGKAPSGQDVSRALTTFRLPTSLATCHLVRAEDVTEERHYTPGMGDPHLIILHQGGGMGRSIRVSTPVAAIVGASDGELSFDRILGALASVCEVDESTLAREVDEPIRELIRTGMLYLT